MTHQDQKSAARPSLNALYFSRIRHWMILLLGPTCVLYTLLTTPPALMPPEAWLMVGVTSMMALWWIFEVIPIPVTSLLPLILLPLLGVADIKTVATPYAHPIIALFFGGFMIGMAMERWGLHKRIAINIMLKTGSQPAALIGGFMIATAFLSMWVSNTATSVMMLPIGLSVAAIISNCQTSTKHSNTADEPFTKALLLAIAYSASIGGLATLIGTPPNALLAAYLSETYQRDIGFAQWMMIGLPVASIMLILTWLWLTRWGYQFNSQPFTTHGNANTQAQEKLHSSVDSDLKLNPNANVPAANMTQPTAIDCQQEVEKLIQKQSHDLGAMNRGEKIVLLVFITTALGWMFRPFLQQYIPGLSDPLIAIVAALCLFIIPVKFDQAGTEFVMVWEKSKDIPWGVFILFGGGLALAAQIKATGLAQWVANYMQHLQGIPILIIILAIVSVIVFLTELTSNTATAAGFLPLLGALAISIDIDPITLAAPAALAASCAFMMPVATPPNAIVFSAGKLKVFDMIRCGLVLNIVGIVVITFVGYSLIHYVFLS